MMRARFPNAKACMQDILFPLRGDFIPLDALLKATGAAGSGGAAKAMVAEGLVQVDGQTELRKTCKMRPGQVVTLAGLRISVQAADPPGPTSSDEGAAPPSAG